MADKTLKVTQIRSSIGRKPQHLAILKNLGLRHIRHTVVVPDTPIIRGMLNKVYYMIKVEE
ncbi:50S ribosomal protein L30 [Succinimonas sp.]|jgi:large subunit ribosomal protein L30|uniref:50S ribosomal protein L30 n=1 Tax=Succinimonas sp. TaxID=1936151 RepID=UPI002E8A5145|nr:50S ribosomal protein L30 [Succinimonas sp.]